MPTTYDEALDQMFEHFTDAWTAGAAAIVGYVPTIKYGHDDGIELNHKQWWVNLSLQSLTSEQMGFSQTINGSQTRHRNRGLFVVQVFGPMGSVESTTEVKHLIEFITGIFRSQRTVNVHFIRCVPEELPKVDGKERFNVFATYEYDSLH